MGLARGHAAITDCRDDIYLGQMGAQHEVRDYHTDYSDGLLARKRFGRHFFEPAWVEKVTAAIALAARANHVVACEIDRDLAICVGRVGRR